MARYDGIADFYVDKISSGRSESGIDHVGAALLDLLGDVAGERFLDLACGHGRVSRALARRGARVVGLDISSVLLERARAAESADPLGIAYVHGDAASPDALHGETFDAVSCHFGLSDIDDLDGALATVARVLRPAGRLACSLLHPCFPGWGDDAPSSWDPGVGYFHEAFWLAANPGFRGKVGSNHRMLGTYLNTLALNGLIVDRCAEPGPGLEWAARRPGHVPVPSFLVLRCHRAASKG